MSVWALFLDFPVRISLTAVWQEGKELFSVLVPWPHLIQKVSGRKNAGIGLFCWSLFLIAWAEYLESRMWLFTWDWILCYFCSLLDLATTRDAIEQWDDGMGSGVIYWSSQSGWWHTASSEDTVKLLPLSPDNRTHFGWCLCGRSKCWFKLFPRKFWIIYPKGRQWSTWLVACSISKSIFFFWA